MSEKRVFVLQSHCLFWGFKFSIHDLCVKTYI